MKRENLTKKYIYEAYRNLLEMKNYNLISVCDICEKAGVSRMSFYRNFESKEDLTFKAIDEITKKAKDRIKNFETVNQYYIIKEFFETFKEFSKIIPSFENSQFSNNIPTILTSKLNNSPRDFINKTTKYVPIFYFSAITATLIEWLKSGVKDTPDEMARLLCSLINIPMFDNCKFENNPKFSQ